MTFHFRKKNVYCFIIIVKPGVDVIRIKVQIQMTKNNAIIQILRFRKVQIVPLICVLIRFENANLNLHFNSCNINHWCMTHGLNDFSK